MSPDDPFHAGDPADARDPLLAQESDAIYASAPIGLCVLDRDRRYVRINDWLAANNGLPAAAHLGRTVREVLPHLADRIEPILDRALGGEEIRGVEFSGETEPGLTRSWRESCVPLRDAEGRIVGVSISVEEVTEEKAAERRGAYLLRLEERLRAALRPQDAMDAARELLAAEIGAEEVRLDPADAPEPDDGRAWIAATLRRGGRPWGMLRAARASARPFRPDEAALLRATAERAWQAAERLRVEAELRNSEARFRQMAETIREVFYVVELDERRMSYVSPAYEEIWARPVRDVYDDAQAFLAGVHPEDRARVEALFVRVWDGETVDNEYRIVRPDGAVRHIRDRAVATTDPATGRRRVVGLAADVTERRRIAERLHLAAGAAGLGIFDVDLRTGAIEWDGRLRALWGVAADAPLTDATFEAGVHPEDRDVMRAAVGRALDPAGDGIYRADYRIRPLDGGPERWIAALGRAHVEEGAAVRLIGTVQDITERRAAEALIAESEARFRALADTMPALVFVTLADGTNIYANERYGAYTGVPATDLLGQGWRRTVHPEDLKRIDAAWRESRTSGAEFVAESRVRRHDGAYRWHLTRGSPVRDTAGQVVEWVGSGTDIDEMVEAREALAASRLVVERANAELETRVTERTASLVRANLRLAAEIEQREAAQAALVQSQKLEAVGQLTSGIAHDFNNVIAAIAGGFAVIERRTDDPRILEVARHGARAAERGGTLVRQLLAFARQQVLAPRACDLAALLREAEPLLARSLAPGVGLAIDCPEDLGEVRVDPVQLEVALINLAVNANDAMEGLPERRLTVAARPSGPEDAERPPEIGPRPAVALAVADTGGGIPEGLMGRVVEPFFTTKPPGRGTGLGLAMVHGFVHQSGGALRIESREGEGTTVTLWLPLAGTDEATSPDPVPYPVRDPAPDVGPDRAPRAGEDARLGGDPVVLLVDDDAAVRGVTAAQLADLGYRVIEAGSAAEALERLEALGEVGAVLTDVVMPGGDGVALAEAIRGRDPDLPIVFMTGRADRARLAGEAVLDKPFAPEDLAAALAGRIAPRRP